MRKILVTFALFLLGASAACRPDLGERESLVTSERVLAVRAEPPEAKPGATVFYRALVARREGTVETAAVSWAFCASPKLLAENNVVSGECLGDSVRPFGDAATEAAGKTPDDACALFGPETPPGDMRPHDPDVTGGFFQPVRASVDGQVSFALERVTCHLANASADVATDYATRYVANRNPALLPLSATVDGAPRALDLLPAGRKIRFQVGWPKEDAESYVSFDVSSQSLVPRREAMRVSWFATDGVFDADRSGRGESDAESATDNGWTAPARSGRLHVWIVLRDSRGGSSFAAYDLTTIAEGAH